MHMRTSEGCSLRLVRRFHHIEPNQLNSRVITFVCENFTNIFIILNIGTRKSKSNKNYKHVLGPHTMTPSTRANRRRAAVLAPLSLETL
jgi:hypothetical protein